MEIGNIVLFDERSVEGDGEEDVREVRREAEEGDIGGGDPVAARRKVAEARSQRN